MINVPPLPFKNIPANAMAGPVHPQEPVDDWNGLLILGEAPTRVDIIEQTPISGPPGEILETMLSHCGIERLQSLVSTVFFFQPCWTPMTDGTRKNNDVMQFFTKETAQANEKIHEGAPFRSSHVRLKNANDLRYNWTVIQSIKPKAILCLGATALWFTTGLDKLMENKGKVLDTPICSTTKVIATLPPATAIYKNYDAATLDTIKADIFEVAKIINA